MISALTSNPERALVKLTSLDDKSVDKDGVDCSLQGAGHKQAKMTNMKLIDLTTGDRFYWKGKKYQIFLTLRHPVQHYNIPCYEPPQGKVVDVYSDFDVKPIIRLS